MDTTVIDNSVSFSNYDLDGRATGCKIIQAGDFKIKLTVAINIGARGKTARAEVWSPQSLTWNYVHNIQAELMRTPDDLPRKLSISESHASSMDADMDRLLEVTLKILN
jgi:hypothetical protein